MPPGVAFAVASAGRGRHRISLGQPPSCRTMNLILLAVPFFFLLIALELLADRVRGMSTYRLADSLNSLSAGVLSQASGLLSKAVAVLGYAFAYQHLHLTVLPDEP